MHKAVTRHVEAGQKMTFSWKAIGVYSVSVWMLTIYIIFLKLRGLSQEPLHQY